MGRPEEPEAGVPEPAADVPEAVAPAADAPEPAPVVPEPAAARALKRLPGFYFQVFIDCLDREVLRTGKYG